MCAAAGTEFQDRLHRNVHEFTSVAGNAGEARGGGAGGSSERRGGRAPRFSHARANVYMHIRPLKGWIVEPIGGFRFLRQNWDESHREGDGNPPVHPHQTEMHFAVLADGRPA